MTNKDIEFIFLFKELKEKNIFNKVYYVTIYYLWVYRGGDLWRLMGVSNRMKD